MASKTGQLNEPSNDDIEELLDTVDKTLDRVKVLYEQYFLGIQKQPPTHLHADIERKLRDLAHMQIRNTALRYKFAMLQQKFGSYNSYWRRTLRQIENGTYTRNLQKIGRQAARSGEDIPEEILAAMPKLMREQIRRDREAALALARRRAEGPQADVDATTDDFEPPTILRREKRTSTGAHVLSESDADFDLDAFFAEVQAGTIPPPMQTVATRLGTQAIPTIKEATFSPAVPTVPVSPTTPASTPTKLDGSAPMPLTPSARGPARPNAPAPGANAPPPTTTRLPTAPGAASAKPPAGTLPSIPRPSTPPPLPNIPRVAPTTSAPSQVTRPNPIAPGSAARVQPVDVESMAGPFAREPNAGRTPAAAPPKPTTPSAPIPRPPQPSATTTTQMPRATPPRREPADAGPIKPPPGMSDADVNALYAKYIKAKESVGEQTGPGSYTKLLKTINQQAPKIMEQYNAKGVDFTVVVKDNQVIIRAKPKT